MQLKQACSAEWWACIAEDVRFRGRISNMWRVAHNMAEKDEDHDYGPAESYHDEELSDANAQERSDIELDQLQGRPQAAVSGASQSTAI